MFGAGKLLPLLPLGVVVVGGRRQHGVWEKPTAGAKASRERDAIIIIINFLLLSVNYWIIISAKYIFLFTQYFLLSFSLPIPPSVQSCAEYHSSIEIQSNHSTGSS